MNNICKFSSAIAVLFCMVGCSEPTPNERREKQFSEIYEKEIKSENYCEAYKIASQFPTMDDGETSERTTKKHMKKWSEYLDEASTACKKQIWPKVQSIMLSELDELKKKLTLRNITVKYLGGSLRPDNVERYCLVDFEIINGSDFDISEINGGWVMGGVTRRFSYDIHEYIDAEAYNNSKGFYMRPRINKIESKTTRVGTVCDHDLYRHIAKNGSSDILIEVTSVKLDAGKGDLLYLSKIPGLILEKEKQLSLGVDGIDLPAASSVYLGQRY